MQYFLFIAGLVLIIKSADVLIDASSKLAKRFGVSSFVIGVTVVAFGTSAPELTVGIVSGIEHANSLTLGNVVGSSLSNTALIVGLAAVIMPLRIKDTVVRREIPILLGVQLALAAMLLADGLLSRLEGILLLVGFVGFMVYVIINSKKSMRIQTDAEGDIDTDFDGNRLPPEAESEAKEESVVKLWLFSLLSLAGLFVGGKLAVSGATGIAQSLGLSETLIGLTVVAIATTMPELITSVMAAVKREPDIVIGNCIGSNMFNILLVLGLSSAIWPIPAGFSLLPDILLMVALTCGVFVVSLLKKRITRAPGIVLLSTYAAYLVFKIVTAL